MTDAAQSGASADAVKDEGTAAGNGVIVPEQVPVAANKRCPHKHFVQRARRAPALQSQHPMEHCGQLWAAKP